MPRWQLLFGRAAVVGNAASKRQAPSTNARCKRVPKLSHPCSPLLARQQLLLPSLLTCSQWVSCNKHTQQGIASAHAVVDSTHACCCSLMVHYAAPQAPSPLTTHPRAPSNAVMCAYVRCHNAL